MPRRTSKTRVTKISVNSTGASQNSYFEKLESNLETNQSKVSMVLGALIILVVGILIFNYFNKNKATLGPAQQTESQQDVSPGQLPGKYTVKDGDTLFSISDKYYQNGYKYTEVAKVNNLSNPDQIEAGQVLEIPKLEEEQPQQSETSPQPTASPESSGTGSDNITIWGPKIDGNTYTVVEGDWLSKIAGRAYGDIFAYQKIAQANNIPNPDEIEPGTVLTIPR